MSNLNSVLFKVFPSGVANVSLNRPEKRNAFHTEMVQELSRIFDVLSGSNTVRVVFIRGMGSVFCAGADLKSMKSQGRKSVQKNEEDAMFLAEMLYKLRQLPQLTIALVQGAAMGGGLGLLAACDLSIAFSSTKMAFPEVQIGLIPSIISPYIIEAIGAHKARALFVSGDQFTAKEAKDMGLVYQIVETEQALEKLVEHYVQKAFKNAPKAVAESKRLVEDLKKNSLNPQTLRMTAHRLARRRTSEEGIEGLTSFLEKRKPEWGRK